MRKAHTLGRVAELADARDLKSLGLMAVRVQIPPCPPVCANMIKWAVSSVRLERHVDIVEVTGSIPVSPTSNEKPRMRKVKDLTSNLI